MPSWRPYFLRAMEGMWRYLCDDSRNCWGLENGEEDSVFALQQDGQSREQFTKMADKGKFIVVVVALHTTEKMIPHTIFEVCAEVLNLCIRQTVLPSCTHDAKSLNGLLPGDRECQDWGFCILLPPAQLHLP